MEDKLRRIAELHNNWETLTDEETAELIELKNSFMTLGGTGMEFKNIPEDYIITEKIIDEK